MIAVDASVALKRVLKEPDSDVARNLWQTWIDRGEVVIAPVLFRAETLSVVRQNVHRGLLTAEQGEAAYTVLENLGVEFLEPGDLYRVAWQYAQRFNRPTVYDCCYLALAAIVGCEFWTADRRLANAVGGQLPWIHALSSPLPR